MSEDKITYIQDQAERIGDERKLWDGFKKTNPYSVESEAVMDKNLEHLKSEVEELVQAIDNKDPDNIKEEVVDICMIAMGIAKKCSVVISEDSFNECFIKNKGKLLSKLFD